MSLRLSIWLAWFSGLSASLILYLIHVPWPIAVTPAVLSIAPVLVPVAAAPFVAAFAGFLLGGATLMMIGMRGVGILCIPAVVLLLWSAFACPPPSA